MTINVGIVTAEALVLGCDSIASVTEHLLDPFRQNVTDNADGSMRIDFDMDDLVPTVTGAWDGVTKMFELSQSPPVAAVTAGLAKLNGLNMSSLASEFAATRHAQQAAHSTPVTVEDVATAFLKFMRARYEKHYADSPLPEQFRDGPEFLIGGFGTADAFPSLYRVNVQEDSCHLEYGGGECGVTWGGESDAVERLLRGYDAEIRFRVDALYAGTMRIYRAEITQAVAQLLSSFAAQVGDAAEGLQTQLPKPPVICPWGEEALQIRYADLPLQDAVDLVAFLVTLQSARAKFGSGVATVGGRTHVGVITKQRFVMLEEPQLKHTNTGFTS